MTMVNIKVNVKEAIKMRKLIGLFLLLLVSNVSIAQHGQRDRGIQRGDRYICHRHDRYRHNNATVIVVVNVFRDRQGNEYIHYTMNGRDYRERDFQFRRMIRPCELDRRHDQGEHRGEHRH